MQTVLQIVAKGDLCDLAKQRWYGNARWVSLWTILVFALRVISVGILILAIVYATDGEYGKAVVSGVASVLDGAAVAWILARRNEALKEANDAWKEVEEHCDSSADAEAARQKLTFMGIR